MNAGRQTVEDGTTGADDAPIDPACLDDGPPSDRRGRSGGSSHGSSDRSDASGDAPEGPGGPIRKCLATGARKPQAEMIRFVLGPEGEVVPDLAQRLPGRGMWLSADLGSIKTACARNLFAKAARARVRPPADLHARVERLLTRRCIDILSLARRAGEAVTGFEKVRALIARGEAVLLVEAADGAEDGRRKLSAALTAARAASGAAGGGGDAAIVSTLDAAEIGEAFGRDRAVHAALSAGGLARKLAREMRRLEGLRADAGADEAGGRR
ncbi:MAG: RNA-binding protein [Marivibrio sp.]|uniref:RNA-binding protein n=1 Tax=Marivibrio sp. TaxID=2039719 RepID=UPI0032EBAF7A